MLYNLPIVILQYINNMLVYNDQIKIINLCKKFKQKLYITNLNVSLLYSNKITQTIVDTHTKLIWLNLYDNTRVSNLNSQHSIKDLNISGSCNIKQIHINHLLNLISLDISNNVNITNITNFKKLEKLKIMGTCNISIDQINNVQNLKIIHIKFNSEIIKNSNKINKNIIIIQ
jgi:hypothetical protein